jgi:hypothetical protein
MLPLIDDFIHETAAQYDRPINKVTWRVEYEKKKKEDDI